MLMTWVLQLFAALLATLSVVAWGWVAARVARGDPVVAYEPRRPVPWRGLDLLIIALFFATTAALLALGLALVLDSGGPDEKVKRFEVALLAGTAANVLTIGFALVWLVRRAGAQASDLGWRRDTLGSDVQLGLGAFAALGAPVYGLHFVLSQFSSQQHPIIELFGEQPSVWLFALGGLSVVIVAPLAEEFFFRGLLQGWLESLAWKRGAIVFSSLLFAAMHWDHGAAPVSLFFFSLGLGWLYQRTHRLLPSIVVHLCLNACSLMLLPLAPSDVAG